MKLAICAITDDGALLARKLGALLPGAEVWLPERQRCADSAHYTTEATTALLPRLFTQCAALICIMATGIVVRSLGPHLHSKQADPAVVVLDETGRFVISLLSGHLGGANALAEQVALLLGATPVITTATDVHELLAWDEAARRANLGIEPLERIRFLNSLLLRGEPIALVDREGLIAPWFVQTPGVSLAPDFSAASAMKPAGRVFVTERRIPQLASEPDLLLLRPRRLVLGIGCNRGTAATEIEMAAQQVLTRGWFSLQSVGRIATIREKADEEGLVAFARQLRLPLLTYDRSELNAVPCPSPSSAPVFAAVGAHGVCEPAALLASGGGKLLISKQKIGNVTIAVARLHDTLPLDSDNL